MLQKNHFIVILLDTQLLYPNWHEKYFLDIEESKYLLSVVENSFQDNTIHHQLRVVGIVVPDVALDDHIGQLHGEVAMANTGLSRSAP
jgi:hypothetical protein